MQLSRKLRILAKLYFLSRIKQEDIDACDKRIINQAKEEMREERERNREKIHFIQLDEFLDENNIRSLDY